MRLHQNGSLLLRSASIAVVVAATASFAPHAASAQAARATTAAAAASAPNNIEELVVTARKRAERLRDIPVAVTALSAEDIQEQGGIPTPQSLLANVPGVNFANTSNPITSDVSLRGSGTSRATNAEAGVGLFRNGAFIGGGTVGGRTFTDLDLFDPARIEVLRGVQGGLNGRNAEGGSINVISARPAHNNDGWALGGFGMHKLGEVAGATNIDLGEHFAARLSVDMMKQSQGFYHLYVINQYADAQFKYFYRGQLAFDYGKFHANLMYEHGAERLPGLVFQVVTFPNATFPKGNFGDKYETPWNSPSKAKQDVGNFELTTNYDLDFAQFDSVTMFRDRHGENAYDRDASSIEFARQAIAAGRVAPAQVNALLATDLAQGGDQLDHARLVYNDAHLSGDNLGGAKVKWIAGGEYFLLKDTPSNVLEKTPTAASNNFGTWDKGTVRFESYAFYGSLGYDITEQLNLSGDLRYTHDKGDFHTRRFDFGTGAPVAGSFNVDGARQAGNTSYTATLTYKPITDQLVYGKIGTGYRAGGFNSSLGDPRQPIPVPVSFGNETLTAYEVGYKGNLLSNLYLAAAYYENHFDDLIIQGTNGCALGNPVCPVQATSFAFNAGPAKMWGMEVELTGRADILGGAARLTVGAARQGGKITGGVDKGLHQPQQPKFTETFNLNYKHPLWIDGVTAFGNLQGNSRQGGVQEVAQVPPLDDYTNFNGRVGIDWGRYELSAYSNNLGQANYLVFDAPSATNDVRRYNLPRTWGVQLRVTW